MRRYYFRAIGMWMHADANRRKEIATQDIPFDDILTEKQAQKRAETDPILAEHMRNADMCDLMCS